MAVAQEQQRVEELLRDQLQEVQQRKGMEIVFYDVETTVPMNGQAFEILEFGAVVVSGTRFIELDSFSTLVRPSSLTHVTNRSIECNGIRPESLEDVPSFADISDRVFALLDGRVWAGHNILRFDNVRIKEAFARIDKPAPQASGFIDTLPLLRKTFGSRLKNNKMATIAAYFGLGKQEHRSLADVRLNIEVLKFSATVMFLENHFPDIYVGTDSNEGVVLRSTFAARIVQSVEKSPVTPVTPPVARRSLNGFDMTSLAMALEEAAGLPLPPDEPVSNLVQPEDSNGLPLTADEPVSNLVQPEDSNSIGLEPDKFTQPEDVSLNLLEVRTQGPQQFVFMHGARQELHIRESMAKVRFSVSNRFAFSDNGKPTFSIVVIPSTHTIAIVKQCEALLKKQMPTIPEEAWRRVLVMFAQEEGMRIKIGTIGQGESARYTTRILKNGRDVTTDAAVDAKTFQEMVPVGCVLDVAFSFLAYAYPGGYAGLQLLADHLVIQ